MSSAARAGQSRSRPVHRTGTLRTGAARSVNRRPDLRLVTGPVAGRTGAAGRATRRAPFVLLVLALLAGTTLALLVLNTAIAVDSLHANALRRDNAQKSEQVQQLERRVIAGDTPQQLAAAAASAGMVPDARAGYLVIEPDGSSTLRGTPVPAPPPAAAAGQPSAPNPDPAQNPGPAQDQEGAPAPADGN